MEWIKYLIDFVLHLDKGLAAVLAQFGNSTYLLLFLIVFCETGLVVTPFLPGDSLLFAAGALGHQGLDPFILAVTLSIAAILGDLVNYHVGKFVGVKVFQNENSRFFKREHLIKTHKFYEKYGAKTIILARFVPIVRTFAPFLAGMGYMTYARFAVYNVVGALLWVWSLIFAGYFFAEVPIVKNNFGLVIVGIIIISVLPLVIEFVNARRGLKSTSTAV